MGATYLRPVSALWPQTSTRLNESKGVTERLTVLMKSCDKSRNGSTRMCRLDITITQLRAQTFSFPCHCESTPHSSDLCSGAKRCARRPSITLRLTEDQLKLWDSRASKVKIAERQTVSKDSKIKLNNTQLPDWPNNILSWLLLVVPTFSGYTD